MKKSIEEILGQVFGLKQFRSLQKEAVDSVIKGQDTLVILPTGGGKSLCYQLPAVYLDGVCLVISPLIALMKDQVDSLKQNGIEAAFINSSINKHEENEILNQASSGVLKLLYVSPERLMSEPTLFLQRLPLSLIAVDEAHCISQWGHDFRPEYTKLKIIKQLAPSTPIIALTATADKITRTDIAEQLGMHEPNIMVGSFNRANLSLTVRPNMPAKDKRKEIISFIKKRPNDFGIIYCLSRKETEKTVDYLNNEGISAKAYHAGLANAERSAVQEAFIADNIQVVCATVAFGMGIDKSNVRWIIHNNLPKNIEGYYQEIGRAGRDGVPSNTVLYYNYGDFVMLARFADDSKQKELVLEKLNRMYQYAEADICRRKILLSYFGEYLEQDCGNCDVCQNPPKRIDGTILAQKALSAIVRTNQKLGMNMLIDVLRGSRKQELVELGYHKIKTYGAGADMGAFKWQHYINQLINTGVIEIAYNDNFNLKVTELGNAVLFGKQRIQLAEMAAFAPDIKAVAKKPKKKQIADELFERLRLLRKTLADNAGVAPYLVFNDATLHEMAEKKPLFMNQLLEITGVGQHKAVQYGDEFVNEIRDFTNQIESKKTKGKTYVETLDLYNKGYTVEQIAEHRGLHSTTVYSHFAYLLQMREDIDIKKFVSDNQLDKVRKAKAELNSTEVKDIFNLYGGELDYGVIRLALTYLEL